MDHFSISEKEAFVNNLLTFIVHKYTLRTVNIVRVLSSASLILFCK